MMTQGWRAACALAAGGVLAATLSACGGASAPARSTSAASPAALPSAVYGSVGYIQTALDTELAKVTSMHVDASFSFPQEKLTLGQDMNLQADGKFAGVLTDSGQSGTVAGIGSELFVRITPAVLKGSALAGQCAQVCGKYVQAPASSDQVGDMKTLGWAGTMQVLNGISNAVGTAGATARPVTYHGQPATEVTLPAYGPGAYAIFTDNAACVPLMAVAPGSFSDTYSQWNAVPALTVPAGTEVVPLSRFS